MTNLSDWDVEIELEGENCSRQENYEHHEGGVFKVCELQVQGAELNAPSNVGVCGRRLESHGLPVGGLDVLKER